MKAKYARRLGKELIAEARLSAAGARTWTLDWVHVPPASRGSGIGRRLLERVLKDADREHVRLTLEVRACAGEGAGPDQERLTRFYKDLGFRLVGRRGTFGPVMVRRPRRAAA